MIDHNELAETPEGWTRSELTGGYYIYIVPSEDLRDPPSVLLFDKNGVNLNVAFDSDAYFNTDKISEGIARKINETVEHLKDLETAWYSLRVLSK